MVLEPNKARLRAISGNLSPCGTVLRRNRRRSCEALQETPRFDWRSDFMSIRLSAKLKLAAIAGALVLGASAAAAQDYDRDRDTTETIRVYAPRHFAVERRPMNGPVQKISLSRSVRYDDLDLRTRTGAHELRMRVNAAAADVCSQLADISRIPEQPGTSCFTAAKQDALLRADAAIRDAREY
jgi:UrcA family protein